MADTLHQMLKDVDFVTDLSLHVPENTTIEDSEHCWYVSDFKKMSKRNVVAKRQRQRE